MPYTGTMIVTPSTLAAPGSAVSAYTDRLAQTVSQGDKRLIRKFQADLASSRHMAWMRWYYPELAGMASAVAYGCPVFCRYCFVDNTLKYPKAAANLVERERTQYPQADFYSGSEVVTRLSRLAKKHSAIANRLAQTELFITPAFALEFITQTLATQRSLAIESTCLELGADQGLAQDFTRAVAKDKKRVRLTGHVLSPSPDLISTLVGRDEANFQSNLRGIAAVARSGVDLHMVFLAFCPPDVEKERFEKALRDLKSSLLDFGLDPAALELRQTRPYGDTLERLQKQYGKDKVDQKRFKSDFEWVVGYWQQLVPGYQIPYRTT